jgi:DNA-binding CsgD family transcriptional regulator
LKSVEETPPGLEQSEGVAGLIFADEVQKHMPEMPPISGAGKRVSQPIARLAFDFGQARYVYCDEAIVGVTGFSAQETIELGLAGFTGRYEESTATTSLAIMSDTLRALKHLSSTQRERAQASSVHRFRHRKGHWIWILIHSVPLQFEPDSKALRLSLSYMSDITPHYFLSRPSGSVTFPTTEKQDSPTTTLELPLRTPQPGVELSNRERDVLRMIVSGNTSKEIADKLGLAVPTVSTHRKNLLIKTRCRNTAELVSFAVSFGLT